MEEVRLLVQEEGRAARNLIAFNVPVDQSQTDSSHAGKILTRKPPTSPRQLGESKREENLRPSKRTCETLKPGSRVRSASTGRDKKSELQARYWAFLFGNLQRAVDEIYQTCETDENVSECKEVILVLENYTRDFHNLIEWFKVKWEYENTPPPQRPTSLAWEIRKSSPGKVRGIASMNASPHPASRGESPTSPLPFHGVPGGRRSPGAPDTPAAHADHSAGGATTQLRSPPPVREEDEERSQVQLGCGRKTTMEPIEKEQPDGIESVAVEGAADSVRPQPQAELRKSEPQVPQAQTQLQGHQTQMQGPQPQLQPQLVSSEKKDSQESHQKVENNMNESAGRQDAEETGERPAAVNELPPAEPRNKDICVGTEDEAAPTPPPEEGLGGVAFPAANKLDQASQTDMEQCIEGSDGLRFLAVPQPEQREQERPPATYVAVAAAPAGPGAPSAAKTAPARPAAAARPSATARPAAPLRPAPRPAPRPVARLHAFPVRQPAATPRLTRPPAPTPARATPTARPAAAAPGPRLVRSKTSTDVRPASRGGVGGQRGGLLLRRPPAETAPARPLRPTLAARQSSQGRTPTPRAPSGPALQASPPGEELGGAEPAGEGLERRPSSSSSINSAASVRSWADKVRGPGDAPACAAHTTVSVEVLPRAGGGQDDDDSQGWETVRGRSRSSRSSPANKAEAAALASAGLGSAGLSRSSGCIKRGAAAGERRAARHVASRPPHLRFHQPSAATSLPALALLEVESPPPPEPAQRPARRQPPASAAAARLREPWGKGNPRSKTAPAPASRGARTLSMGSGKLSALQKPKLQPPQEQKIGRSVVLEEPLLVEKEMEEEKKSKNEEECEVKDDEAAKETEADANEAQKNREEDLEERHLSEDEQRKSEELSAAEARLRQEIQELETTDIEVDTETDETETDGEATLGPEEGDEEHEGINSDKSGEQTPPADKGNGSCSDLRGGVDGIGGGEDPLTLEARYGTMLEGMSWQEREDVLEQLQELVARHPGRALELHQKLSSPSRRRTLPEALRRFQAKQALAKAKREALRQERSQRIRELLNKVEEVKAARAQLLLDKRVRLEQKLKRAEDNRNMHLRGIVRKAHDEEEKLKEIAFINELEAQNKRHDFMALCQEQQERLQGIQEERQRRLEEKAAKEAAAEERRRALEAERQERLEKMQELRRKRDERVGRKQQEREKERQELAREKARDREERLSALHAAQLATQEELQKKIQQKQEDSARRHEENIEHIRQRALESTIMRCSTDDVAPRLAPYDTLKLCKACNVLIGSEVYLLSHLRGKKHQETIVKQHGPNPSHEELTSYNIKHIVDAPADKIDPKIALDKERQKALKKRCKKIRLRMATRGQDYESKRQLPQKVDSPNKGKLLKCLRDIEKLHSSQGKGQWSNNSITGLERALGEISRMLSKQSAMDQLVFQCLNGFTILSSILGLALEVPPNMAPYLPPKCFVTTCNTYSLACKENTTNCKYVLLSNKISTVLDLLLHRLEVLIPQRTRPAGGGGGGGGGGCNLPVDAVAGALMSLLSLVLTHAVTDEERAGRHAKTGRRRGSGSVGSGDAGGEAADARDDLWPRVQDVISYTVSVGVVDKLALYCGGVRDPIDSDPPAANFLLAGLQLLTTLTARCSDCSGGGRGGRGGEDATQLTATLQVTELVGAVSMLYGMLLQQGVPARGPGASPPPPLPPHTVAVTNATIRLLGRVAELDLHMLQSVLGAEGISLQFRHIASYLLWYCTRAADTPDTPDHAAERELLHEVVRVVGFFAVRNSDNQMMLQAGFMPTVLQQLCSLPFAYFSTPALSALLFPTLLACCSGNDHNRAILEQEVSYQLLEDFRKSEAAQRDPLVMLLDGSGGAAA